MTPRRPPVALVALVALALAGSGRARGDTVDDTLARFAAEPTVRDVQEAALRHAALDPERARSWERRLRLAALAPALRLAVGRGARLVATTTSADGSQRLVVGDNSTWSVDASAAWSLDRLVFDREELRLSREAQRVASRREALLTDIARLYFERRELQALLVLAPPTSVGEALSMRLRVDEIGAVLDGLSGGALSRRSAGASVIE